MKKIVLGSILLFVSSFLVTACGDIPLRQWFSHRAQVLDTKTGKPLEGVVVLARWNGVKSMLVDGQSTCYHVETATTDKNGWFEIPSYNEGFGQASIYRKRIDLSYYRKEYFFDTKVRHYGMAKKIHMKLFEGTKRERFKFLSSFYTLCSEAGDSNKNSYNIHDALYNEAQILAKTSKDLRRLKFMLMNVEVILYGPEEANKRLEKRLEEQR